MEGDLREVLKRAIYAEGAGSVGGGPVGGRAKKKKKGGISPLSMLGTVEMTSPKQHDKLQSLVKQMIHEEIKQQGGRASYDVFRKTKKSSVPAKKSKKGGFHGMHPIEMVKEMIDEYEPECSCHCKIHGSGPVAGKLGGMIKKKKKALSPHLFPHNSAVKALKGIKFNSREERQAVINHLASMYNHMATRPENVKFMKEYIAQHIE